MVRFQTLLFTSVVTILGLALPSCTATLDGDRFRKAGGGLNQQDAASATNQDVSFSAKSMGSHANEYFEIRVVDKDNRVQAKVVYADVAPAAPGVSLDFSFYLKGIVPRSNPPYRLDFWADHNTSGVYDGIEGGINEKDHAWRRVLSDPLPDGIRFVDNRYEVAFVHDTNFNDIYTDLAGNPIPGTDTLLPFKMNVRGADAFAGKFLEIRVVDKATGRLVALHRRGNVPATYSAEVLGVVDEETPYEVSAYADANGDGKFSSGDPSWKLDIVSSSAGVTGDLDVAALPATPIDTGEPK
jgi:hypothetical protein